MNKKEHDEIARQKKKVFDLCADMPAHLVIVLAAATLDWNVMIDKGKGKNAIVDGIVVGTDDFLKRHGEI